VDLDHARLHVPLKGEKRMEVALDAELGRELLGLRSSGPLFASAQGRRLSTRAVQLRFAGWVRAAGVERGITVHGLRHTFGTRAYEETKDIRRVQRALGHGSVVTTERYTAAGSS
jgi:integrase/recombinase XerC